MEKLTGRYVNKAMESISVIDFNRNLEILTIIGNRLFTDVCPNVMYSEDGYYYISPETGEDYCW